MNTRNIYGADAPAGLVSSKKIGGGNSPAPYRPDPYRPARTASGDLVINQNVGPGGSGMGGMGEDNRWMAAGAPITFEPGTAHREAVASNPGLTWDNISIQSGVNRGGAPAPGTQSLGVLGNQNTWRSGGGGGGGGGVAPNYAGIDQATFDWLMAQAKKRPKDLQFNPFVAPEMNRPDFYDFDSSQYDMARGGLKDAIRTDTARGNQAYDDAAFELDQFQNPFANASWATTPGMSASMQQMMAANQTTPDRGTINEGQQADAAFGNVMGLLAGAANQRAASDQRAVAGDRRRFGEDIGQEGRMLGMGIDMAQAKAREQYDQNKFMYGVDTADKIYDSQMQAAMTNYARSNQVGDTNTQTSNQFDMNFLAQIAPWAQAGMVDGKQTLDLGGK